MKCKRCGKNDAAFFITWETASGPRIGFCETCGEEVGIFTALRRVESLLHGFGARGGGDVLFGDTAAPFEFAEECKNCGTTVREFERRFLFGCEECSKVFGSVLSNYLTLLGAQPDAGFGFYRGETPKTFAERTKLGALMNKLRAEIESEDYHAAAAHRDKLNELEEKLSSGKLQIIDKLSKKKIAVPSASGQFLKKLLLKTPEMPPAGESWLVSHIETRRNLADFNFPTKLDDAQRILVERYILDLLPKKWTNGLRRVPVGDLKPIEALAFGERFFWRRPSRRSGAFISADGARTALINDTDHLTLGVRSRERDPGKALAELMQPIRKIESKAEIAFSPRFGFLTTAPKHIGAGLTVSILLHLPYCFFRGRSMFWPDSLARSSVRLESYCGKNLEHHAFYRVSSAVGFGGTAEDLICETFEFAEKLIGEEMKIRADFKPSEERRLINILPNVFRHATRSYRLSYQDVLRFATFFSLGVERGVAELPEFSLDDVLPLMSSTHLMYRDGTTYSVNQCEKRRADLFAELVHDWSLPAKIKH
jgi:protein arginine kinase